jgi:hypothetical protein
MSRVWSYDTTLSVIFSSFASPFWSSAKFFSALHTSLLTSKSILLTKIVVGLGKIRILDALNPAGFLLNTSVRQLLLPLRA